MEWTEGNLNRFCVRKKKKRIFKCISKAGCHWVNRKKKIKRFIQNWTPILSVDLKIISKALSEKLKNLISTHQTAYVKNKHLGESGKLTSDIKEIARSKKFEAFLVKMDIEKSFDSLDHDFLISTLEKYALVKTLSYG